MMPIEVFIFLFVCISFSTSNRFCPNDQPITNRGIPDDDILAIMYKHLQYRYDAVRGRIPGQPVAEFMEMLEWDDKLAEQAQKIADMCTFKMPVSYDDRWDNIGQNVLRTSSKFSATVDWRETVEKWFSENHLYVYPVEDSSALNYEQIVWANTTHIGCGFVEFKTTDFIFPYESLYICNYSPAGNIAGQPPYIIKGTDENRSM